MTIDVDGFDSSNSLFVVSINHDNDDDDGKNDTNESSWGEGLSIRSVDGCFDSIRRTTHSTVVGLRWSINMDV